MARSLTVLIVDDSDVARAVLASRLVQAGAAVVEASSSADALSLDASTITAAIVDVDLGAGDNGVSLATALATRNPEMRLALFTGHAHELAPTSTRTFRKPEQIDSVVAWALGAS